MVGACRTKFGLLQSKQQTALVFVRLCTGFPWHRFFFAPIAAIITNGCFGDTAPQHTGGTERPQRPEMRVTEAELNPSRRIVQQIVVMSPSEAFVHDVARAVSDLSDRKG